MFLTQNNHQLPPVTTDHDNLINKNNNTANIKFDVPLPVIPKYIHQYPQVVQSSCALYELVHMWKQLFNKKKSNDPVHSNDPLEIYDLELECRLGHIQPDGYFQSGVTFQFIHDLQKNFNDFSEWSHSDNWTITTDYFFKIPDSAENPFKNQEVRITACFEMDKNMEKKRMKTKRVVKQSVKRWNLKYNDTSPARFMQLKDNRHYDLRLSLQKEIPVDEKWIDPVINPHLVRIKSRKSWYYNSRNNQLDHAIWRFDITRVWTGTTYSQAEEKQKMGDSSALFEIELECLHPEWLMQSTNLHIYNEFYVACSMLLKMRDLMFYINRQQDFTWDIYSYSSN